MKEDLRPVTYMKNKAADLLEQINTTHRSVVITQNGEARAVLQDPVSYEQMRRAIGLLKLVAQGETDVQAGRTVAADEVFVRLRKRFPVRSDAAVPRPAERRRCLPIHPSPPRHEGSGVAHLHEHGGDTAPPSGERHQTGERIPL